MFENQVLKWKQKKKYLFTNLLKKFNIKKHFLDRISA